MTSIIEYIRQEAINSLFSISSFSNSWTTWKTKISSLILPHYATSHIIDLGDSLAEIFKQTGQSGRSQSSVSGGGTAWEALVCWYLNLCLIESRTIIIRQSIKLIPEPIQKSMMVNYGTFPSNTESDLIAITFPNKNIYNQDINTLSINDSNGNTIPPIVRGKFNYLPIINRLTELDFSQISITIIQCKTNWNDNAQIPMLWDMVYSSQGFPARNISIGSSGFTIKDLKKFSYAFVTVPTNNLSIYNPNSTAVRRVSYISGGNYWGNPTRNGVSSSIKEIFGKTLNDGSTRDLRTDLTHGLTYIATKYSYFQI